VNNIRNFVKIYFMKMVMTLDSGSKSVLIGILAIFLFANKSIGQAIPTLEMDFLGLNPTPPAGPYTTPITVPFSLDLINNNTYTPPISPISLTVSLKNQVFNSLPYANLSNGLTFGGGATLASGGTVQQSASNVPYDLLGAYIGNGGPKSFMFTSNPLAGPTEVGTGFDVDGDLFSPNLNGAVQLFTAAQALFDNNTPKDSRVYFGDIVFKFSQPVKNPVLHFAGLGGSYSYLPFGQPDLATNYLSTFFASELEMVNQGVTSTLLSSNNLMTLSGNDILNNYPLPNGNSFQIPDEYPIDNFGAITGSIRINGVVEEVVYKVYLKGTALSDFNWSAKGIVPPATPGNPPLQLITNATRDPFTGDIWWVAASLLEPTQQVSGNVYNDKDSLLDNNIYKSGSADNLKTNANNQLYANLIDNLGNVYSVTPVASNGLFLFDSVMVGNYSVRISTAQGIVGSPAPLAVLPAGWSVTGEKNGLGVGSDGTPNLVSNSFTVVSSQATTEINFGIRQPLSLGNLIWQDANSNNLFDAGEPGIAGSVVSLYRDDNIDGIKDGGAISSITTGVNGLYIFNNLFEGNYIIGVTPPTPAVGNAFVSSPVNEANPNGNVDNNDNGVTTTAGETLSGTINLSAGNEPSGETPNNGSAPDLNSNLTIDFAFYQPVNITGNVFVDNNGASNVDGTGIGSPSGTQVYANLVNPAGNVVATIPVAANGTYQFTDVQPNSSYSMVLSTTQGTVGNPTPTASLPAGWNNVSEDCCDNTGNDGTTNGTASVTVATSSVSNVNFGITQPLSVGNLVWNDINKDGLKDASEQGITGALVKLYRDTDADGIPNGSSIATFTTLANGLYVFNNLTVGNYVIGVTPPATLGNPFVSSTIDELLANDNVDNNDNGVLNIGTEVFSNTVTLLSGTEPIGELPDNGTASDINSNLTVDFGFYQSVSLSGNIFLDINGPSNVDGTNIFAAGTSQLFANLSDENDLVLATTFIGSNGTYEFLNIEPNRNYKVSLSTTQGIVSNLAPSSNLPLGWKIVSEDCCDNIGNDGLTNGILNVSVVETDIVNANFGLNQPLSLGNLVWIDANRNSLKDTTESGMSNAVVSLYTDNNNDGLRDGVAISTYTTAANGLYIFNDLNAGRFIVGVKPNTPATGNPFLSSTVNENNPNLNIDNNDNGIVTSSGETFSGVVVLNAGLEPITELNDNSNTIDANGNLTVDFGFYQPINLSGNVWHDVNGNSDLLVNNSGAFTTPAAAPIPVGLRAYLVNPTNNTIERLVIVSSANNTFIFNDIKPSTNYYIILSRTPASIGSVVPAASLPAGWVNTGEKLGLSTGNDGVINGRVNVPGSVNNILNANFGIKINNGEFVIP
jgi:hypothetical protein